MTPERTLRLHEVLFSLIGFIARVVYWVHNAPVGYRYKTVKGHGKLLIADEPLASLVRDAFESFAAGRFQTQAEIKRFFETHPDFPRSKHGEVKQKRVND
ncbi:MAG: hypothetical protein N4A70_11345 [Pelagimonas sp.]|jgi:hypothetical protein|nr:hypothetical protein [Pelagimonas sp.]